ncbi:MAG: hypothetical protein FGM14_03335 [Flavobacteriales bacterium]|nr:hypothetical protein [Flavobacteriales bacterium]
MGKITLEFDSVEEAEDIRNALDGYKWKLTIWDLDQHLRNEMKFNNLSNEKYKAFEEIRKKIIAVLNDYQLHLD